MQGAGPAQREVAARHHQVRLLALPHAGVRPFYEKSTCLAQSTLGPYVVKIWSRTTPKTSPHETHKAHRVGGRQLTDQTCSRYDPGVTGAEFVPGASQTSQLLVPAGTDERPVEPPPFPLSLYAPDGLWLRQRGVYIKSQLPSPN